jgi:prophage DNA circulation protein
MGSIRDVHNVWRDSLVPASFRGAVFHVETSGRASGRRVVLHQYPKRNDPYAEDMGREAIRWTFSGYLIHGDRGIGGNLLSQIAQLQRALEADEAGMLMHPMLGAMLVMCEKYSYTDSRTKGGYVEFDMQFVEAGTPGMAGAADQGSALSQSATSAENTSSGALSSDLGSSGLTSSGAPAGII